MDIFAAKCMNEYKTIQKCPDFEKKGEKENEPEP